MENIKDDKPNHKLEIFLGLSCILAIATTWMFIRYNATLRVPEGSSSHIYNYHTNLDSNFVDMPVEADGVYVLKLRNPEYHVSLPVGTVIRLKIPATQDSSKRGD